MPWKVYRDASTGEYVSAEYAAQHPDTTVSETVQRVEDIPAQAIEHAIPDDTDAGYSLIELCVCVLVIIVLVLLIVHYLPAR